METSRQRSREGRGSLSRCDLVSDKGAETSETKERDLEGLEWVWETTLG